MEEGKFPTTVQTFKFPLVSERYVVLTVYRIDNYNGVDGGHFYVASSRTNEDKSSEDYLGRDFTKPRVIVRTDIAVYHCVRKPDGKLIMRWMTEIVKDGIPEWIFKNFQLL